MRLLNVPFLAISIARETPLFVIVNRTIVEFGRSAKLHKRLLPALMLLSNVKVGNLNRPGF